MNFIEMNLRIFQGKPIPHVFFQPRFEPWYDWHRIFKCMPTRYQNLSLQGMYDSLHASMRYMHYYSGMPDPVVRYFSPEVKVHEQFMGAEGSIIYETPYGELVEGLKPTRDELIQTVDKVVKLFHPRLVLGVSDEVPELNGEEAMLRGFKWLPIGVSDTHSRPGSSRLLILGERILLSC